MPLRNVVPARHKPRSVISSFDGTNSVPGGMSLLTNLINDPTTPNTFQCRPAATLVTDFTGITNPGFISAATQIGDKIYGLIASDLTPGFDEPFVYDLLLNSFVTVTGITGANVPTSPADTGDWVPPSSAIMGPYVVFTHPGFNGANGYFGYFDMTNPAAPIWASGNTTTNGLVNPPSRVSLFSNRLYFVDGNVLPYTDTLSFARSSSNQYLTAGDSTAITSLAQFGISTTTQGAIQALVVFKENDILQITGDAATSDLAINSYNASTGTLAPNSVVSTTDGIRFMAPDGIRVLRQDGSVTDPDLELQLPFLSALYNSRVNASYNANIYRICLQNTAVSGTPWQEYWYNLAKESWTGPHTFQQDIAVPWHSAFVLFSHENPGNMYLSQVSQVSGVGFTELGEPLEWIYATSPIGEVDSMLINTCNETVLNMAFASGAPSVTCTAADEDNGVLATATVNAPGASVLWGSFLWGAALWGGTQFGLRPHLIPWTNPLVFTKVIFQATAVSSLGFKISNLRAMIQPAAYLPPP